VYMILDIVSNILYIRFFMSFREKSAWITFFTVLIFSVLWFTHVWRVQFLHARDENPMIWFLGTVVALIALEIALHIAVAVQSPREARTPKDERERLIDMKASRFTSCWSGRSRPSARCTSPVPIV
jgi:hypothetical protein